MSKTTEEIKEKVLKEIEKTENAIKRYQEKAKPVTASGAVGRFSKMNAMNNKTVLSVTLNNAQARLSSLQKVLSQIGTDEYGLCLKCKKPIALGRILARPESLLCVKCAR